MLEIRGYSNIPSVLGIRLICRRIDPLKDESVTRNSPHILSHRHMLERHISIVMRLICAQINDRMPVCALGKDRSDLFPIVEFAKLIDGPAASGPNWDLFENDAVWFEFLPIFAARFVSVDAETTKDSAVLANCPYLAVVPDANGRHWGFGRDVVPASALEINLS